MAQTLESIKGGGGSIKVGATGTISTFMTIEMERITAPRTPTSSRNKPQAIPVSTACGPATRKRPKLRKPSDEASCSKSSNPMKNRSSEIARKTKAARRTHQIPMLGSENISLERTPTREKIDKKMHNLIDIVDVKCGNPEKAWVSPLTSRMKKLGFSKLSESIA